jgi:hypothetical protein
MCSPRNSKPTIVVDDDGGPVTWPIYAHTTLRITSFANGKQTARHLRRCAMGALLAARLPGVYLPKESPAAPASGTPKPAILLPAPTWRPSP